jgi:hypothetical protein
LPESKKTHGLNSEYNTPRLLRLFFVLFTQQRCVFCIQPGSEPEIPLNAAAAGQHLWAQRQC